MGEYPHFSHLLETLQPQSAVHHLLLNTHAAQDISLSWWATIRELSGKHPCTSSSSRSVSHLACLWFPRGNVFSHGLQRHRENAKEKGRHRPANKFTEASGIYCTPPPTLRLSTLPVENQQFRARNIETVQEAQ